MLGWKIMKNGEYDIGLHPLSEEEEKLALRTEESFRERTRSKKVAGEEDARETVRGLLVECAEEEGTYLEDSQLEHLSEFCYCHIYGFAFLTKLLEDDSIEEISVIGTGKPAYVFIRNKGWKTVNAGFTSEAALAEVINKMAAKIGRRITLQNPRLNAVLPDGSRLHASLPPLSDGEITIRKFREKPFAPSELCANGTLSAEAMALLSLAMQGDFSIVVAGNTASGKTTTLNSLFSFVPLNERVVLVEETPEVNILHPHRVRLVSNPEMGITLKELVYDSLRMRPDRLIVGEVRNRGEVEALFDVLLGGQARGSYATFHAQSAKEAVQRFRALGVNEGDLDSIDLVVIQRRMLNYDAKKRKNYEIRKAVEIAEMENAAPAPVFRKDGSGKLVFSAKCGFLERLSSDLGLSHREISEEMKSRTSMISKMGGKAGFAESFARIQKALYGLEPGSDDETD